MSRIAPYIVDTTLRDGEQTPGVVFTAPKKFAIASALNQLGIQDVELGTPAMGKSEQNIMLDMARAGFAFNSISWCRALRADIDAAVYTQTNAVSISFPVSDIQLNALGKNREWVLTEMESLIGYARHHFNMVIVGAQDASRANTSFLYRFTDKALSCGVNRIRIADTVGIMNPITVSRMFKNLNVRFNGTDFEFHPHNDLGMATANAFMARQYGASGISGTVNGIGERAGNAAIEELIMAECVHHQGESAYQTRILNNLCQMVADAADMPIPKTKAICGAHAFTHETGVHVRSLLADKRSYQPFDESLIGLKQNHIVIGKHSGKAALIYFFNQKGVNPTGEQIGKIHQAISRRIEEQGTVPNEHYILKLYHQTC